MIRPNLGFETERDKSDKFTSIVTKILLDEVKYPPKSVGLSKPEQDLYLASDVQVISHNGGTAVRIRDFSQYSSYIHQFTVRIIRTSRDGTDIPTEFAKIMSGCADWSFYGMGVFPILNVYHVMDLDVFRKYALEAPYIDKPNPREPDGSQTWLRAYEYASFPPNLIIASGGPNLADVKVRQLEVERSHTNGKRRTRVNIQPPEDPIKPELVQEPQQGEYWLVSCDYGQIEVRVLAMFSRDKYLIDALWNSYDIHRDWAEKFAKAAPSLLSKHGSIERLREFVKSNWVFALFYGSSIGNAEHHMEVSRNILEPLYNEFWRQFPGVKAWQDGVQLFYETNGYVECLTKRRRRHPLSHNQIINSPIQGTASDIVIDAQNRLSELAFETEQWQFQPRLNIHDDLGFYIPDKTLQQDLQTIKDICVDSSYGFTKCVPLSIEIKLGQDWHKQVKFGVFYTSPDKIKYPFTR